ncbi:MAG: hypothetical protein ACN6OP_26080 [Pseudomonadales bacterium]|jgi:hypothetical protein|uniref:hypothetical protein n=1 Tax=Pseudomonadaceae TaxID=135621 RepID=UPI0021F472BA|nr:MULTISPECIES: hypothetical protein [Pseudomonas]UYP31298.1 hypothetical protein OEG79_04155 [Pseudomonas sp. Z8(2022)]
MSTSAEKKVEPLASDCVVTASPRPDGSLLISVNQGNRKVRRIVDHTCLTQEVVRSIKFELSEMASQEEVVKVIQHYGSKTLPTFSNQPIYRTRCAKMWEMRKLNS